MPASAHRRDQRSVLRALAPALLIWGGLLLAFGLGGQVLPTRGVSLQLHGVIERGAWVPPAGDEPAAARPGDPILWTGLQRAVRLDRTLVRTLMGRIAADWDPAWPHPEDFPGLRTTVRGEVRSEQAGCRLRLVGEDAARWLSVDSRPVQHRLRKVRLRRSGWVPFSFLHHRATPRRSYDADLRLFLRCKGQEPVLVAGNRVRPPADAPRAPRDGRGWIGMGLLLILGGAALRVGPRPELATRRLVMWMALILALATSLRLTGLEERPHYLETADEQANLWNGWHILHGEAPRSWAGADLRDLFEERERFHWFGHRWAMVSPYVPRPPGFGLVVAAASRAWSVDGYLQMPTRPARLVAVAISLVSLLLVFAIAWEAGGDSPHRGRAALLSAGLFAFAPPVVISSRIAKAEGLLGLLLAAAVWLALRERRRPSRRGRWLLFAVVMLGPAVKELAFLVGAGAAFILLAPGQGGAGGEDADRARVSTALRVLAVTALSTGLYLLWGQLCAGELFWQTLSAQAHKAVGFDAGWNLATQGTVVHRLVSDYAGWNLALVLLAAAWTLPRREGEVPTSRHALVGTVAILCLLGLAGLIHHRAWGFYRLLLYPLLCAASGPMLLGILDRARAVPAGLFALAVLLLPLSRELTSPGIWPLRAALWLPLLPLLVHELRPGPRTLRGARATGWSVLAAAGLVGALPEIRSWLGL